MDASSPATGAGAPARRVPSPGTERRRELVAYWLYRAAERLINLVPRGLAMPAAAAVGNVAYDLAGPKRGLLHANLARPMGLDPEDRRVRAAARRAFRNYAKYLVDMMRIGELTEAQAHDLVEIEDLGVLREAQADEKGVLICTVHVGGTLEDIAAAEREAWAGRVPGRPFVLVGQQYLADPGRSQGDVHPVWAYAHVPTGYDGDATPLKQWAANHIWLAQRTGGQRYLLVLGKGIGAVAQAQTQGVQHDRFAGTGFSRQHVEPRGERERERLDDGEVANAQLEAAAREVFRDDIEKIRAVTPVVHVDDGRMFDAHQQLALALEALFLAGFHARQRAGAQHFHGDVVTQLFGQGDVHLGLGRARDGL